MKNRKDKCHERENYLKQHLLSLFNPNLRGFLRFLCPLIPPRNQGPNSETAFFPIGHTP